MSCKCGVGDDVLLLFVDVLLLLDNVTVVVTFVVTFP